MQAMYRKSFSFIAFSIILVMTSPKPAHSEPTKWEDAKTSMSNLLDSGWQIIGHSFNRVAASNTAIGSGFDEKSFTFILTNGRKYILCFGESKATDRKCFCLSKIKLNF
jgi:hypothetical protein